MLRTLLGTIALLMSLSACSWKAEKRIVVSRAPEAVSQATETEKLLTASDTYVTYAEMLPTSHYFEILKPLNCDRWFKVFDINNASQIRGNKQYFLQGRHLTESSWSAQCFKEMHKILRETNDEILKTADGVIFDHDQARIVNEGTLLTGFHHVFMPGWAIRFKDATPQDVLERLRKPPTHVLDLRQIEAAAIAGGRLGVVESIPYIEKLLRPHLTNQFGLGDNKTDRALLEGLSAMPIGAVDEEIWWSLIEGGERLDKLRPGQSSNVLILGYAGAPALTAARALFCARRPGTLERMKVAFTQSLELGRKMAAAKAIAGLNPEEFTRLLQKGAAGTARGHFDLTVKTGAYFGVKDCGPQSAKHSAN